uniref:Ig-like domain-containing protein n=2 Tax=Anopheles atroparvus TaxID=41427 RepID=A0A182IW72_ANOAO
MAPVSFRFDCGIVRQRMPSSSPRVQFARICRKASKTLSANANATEVGRVERWKWKLPPERMVIRDQLGMERTTVAGPYSEGDNIKLRCDVYGGRPTPAVAWYRDGLPLAAETKYMPLGKHLRSEITLGPLTRQDLHTKLVCRASNHARANPVEQSVQIDMNFAPLNIRLIGSHQPLSAGRRYDLLCQSAGSRPAASITWFLDGVRLDKSKETTSADGNQTTSTLSIVLNRTDAGKYLSCKAYNSYVQSDALEDGWQLDIQYVPDAYVKLGSSLDPNSIREGTDVYFDCIVQAHPAVYKVEWKHNNKTLTRNISQGVIVSKHSLVLQGVSRTTAGNFSCVGFNAEGEGSSPMFELNVMYAPTCAPNQPRVYGVAKQENAEIRCVVDANPPDVEFKWTFNNSAESIDVQASHISRLGTSSIVSYTPMTELDYGTLLCSATNKIGKQRQPCVFHIIAAGAMEAKCTVRVDFSKLPKRPPVMEATTFAMTQLGLKESEIASLRLKPANSFLDLRVKDQALALRTVERNDGKHSLECDGNKFPIPITMVDNSVMIKLHDLSVDTTDRMIAEFFSRYGEVRSIRPGVWAKPYPCAGIPDGNRYVTAVLSKPVPSFVTIGGEETLVTYRGQQQTCRTCSLAVHHGMSCTQGRKLIAQKAGVSGRLSYAAALVTSNASVQQPPVPKEDRTETPRTAPAPDTVTGAPIVLVSAPTVPAIVPSTGTAVSVPAPSAMCAAPTAPTTTQGTMVTAPSAANTATGISVATPSVPVATSGKEAMPMSSSSEIEAELTKATSAFKTPPPLQVSANPKAQRTVTLRVRRQR